MFLRTDRGRSLRTMLLALLLVALFAASVVPAFAMGGPGGGHRGGDAKTLEINFMTEMIDHHYLAVQMTDICIARATHSELRDLCAKMKADQSREIGWMQTWLRDWYGINKQPQLPSGGQHELDQLNAASTAEFDKVWMQMMIPHHHMAVMMSMPVARQASHAELRDLANSIISSQSDEIRIMQSWLSQWYGESGGMMGGGGHGGGGHGGMGGGRHR